MAFKVIVNKVDDGQKCSIIKSSDTMTIIIPDSAVNENTIKRFLEICEAKLANTEAADGYTLNEWIDLSYDALISA